MLGQGGRLLAALIVGGLLLATAPGSGSAWAKESEKTKSDLWISADRIVGFAPFTVYVYGTVSGQQPAEVTVCRNDVAWGHLSSSSRNGNGHATTAKAAIRHTDRPSYCASGAAMKTNGRYDFSQDLHFDRAGVYHVRLTTVDAEGNRKVSNTIRVRAF